MQTQKTLKQNQFSLGGGLTVNKRVTAIFNGTYTITNTKTGQHRTFEISTVIENKDNPSSLAGKRIVSLLVGCDNTSDYQGFAFIDDFGIKVWKKLRGENGQISDWEKMAKMLWSMGNGEKKYFDAGMETKESGTCITCNRKLTHPTSLITGQGPVCAGRE